MSHKAVIKSQKHQTNVSWGNTTQVGETKFIYRSNYQDILQQNSFVPPAPLLRGLNGPKIFNKNIFIHSIINYRANMLDIVICKFVHSLQNIFNIENLAKKS